MLLFSLQKSTQRKIYFANEQPDIFKVRCSINNPSFGAKGHWANPFHVIGLFRFALKTSENQSLSGGIERDHWHEMG